MRPWTPDELTELRLLAVWGVVHGDLQAFAVKHGRAYSTANQGLHAMLGSGHYPRMTYQERMDALKGIVGERTEPPKFPDCPPYNGPDWIGNPIDPPKDPA